MGLASGRQLWTGAGHAWDKQADTARKPKPAPGWRLRLVGGPQPHAKSASPFCSPGPSPQSWHPRGRWWDTAGERAWDRVAPLATLHACPLCLNRERALCLLQGCWQQVLCCLSSKPLPGALAPHRVLQVLLAGGEWAEALLDDLVQGPHVVNVLLQYRHLPLVLFQL